MNSTAMSLLPNTLTVVRLILVLPIGWTLWTGEHEVCLAMLIVAGLSDALDGFIARRFNSISRFGELADPTADKLLAFVVVLLMLITELLPLWVVAAVIGREIVIISGALVFRSVVRRLDIEPLLISRINTVVQIVVLAMVVASQTEIPQLASWTFRFVESIGIYLMVLFTVVSGIAYVYTWSNRLRAYLAMAEHRVESSNP